MITFYLYIKAFHIIAVISWMAGMLYLPRLFVYHANKNNTKEMNATFELMEKRLLKYIMNPAMILTWALGIVLIFSPLINFGPNSLWLSIKMILVVIMSGIHGYFGYCRKALIKNNTFYSQKFFRFLNEAPTVLLIIIIILVVVKPYN
ncbi:MAG: protoporphyrinogen oxidase HemJ [Alphaproteobacteria bacterium]